MEGMFGDALKSCLKPARASTIATKYMKQRTVRGKAEAGGVGVRTPKPTDFQLYRSSRTIHVPNHGVNHSAPFHVTSHLSSRVRYV